MLYFIINHNINAIGPAFYYSGNTIIFVFALEFLCSEIKAPHSTQLYK